MTDWYRLPHKTALGLVLIIARSSAVIKITAGKLVQLSIVTFSDVSIHGFLFSIFIVLTLFYIVIISGCQNVSRLPEYLTNCDNVNLRMM